MSTMGYVTTLTGIEDSASVKLDFAQDKYEVGGQQKTFEQLFTVNRASKGGRFNSAGLFEMVEPNKVRMDYNPITKALRGVLAEEQRTNLVGNSTSGVKWNTTRAYLVANDAVGPDGTMSATKVVSTKVADWHYTSSSAISVTANSTYTATIFAKAAEYPRVRIGLLDNNIFTGVAVFDLTTGLRVAGNSGEIQELSNGWFRCSFTATAKIAGNSSLSINPVKAGETDANTAGDGYSGIHIWGGQVELGSFSTSFIPTETSFTSRSTNAYAYDRTGTLKQFGPNVARTDTFSYDKEGVLKPSNLIVENASTNLFVNSNMFELGSWGRNRVDAVPSDLRSPTGQDFFRKLVTTSIAGGSSLYYNTAVLPTNNFVTESFYVKADTTDRCSLRFYDGAGSGAMATFNLTTGTIISNTGPVLIGASINPTGNGIYRVSLTADYTTRSQTGLAIYLYVNFDNPQVGDSIYAWGAQLEAGISATTYIESRPNFVGRATPATYYDNQGTLQTALANVARDSAYSESGSPIGLLLENSATNQTQQSQRFTGNGWGRFLDGAGSVPVVLDNAVTAPDGTMTGARVRFYAPDNTSQSLLSQGFTTVQGVRYTASVYLKASRQEDIGKVVGFRHAGNTGFTFITLTNKWKRVESTETANSTSGIFLVNLRPALGTSSGEVEVCMWGAQSELGGYASSYIATRGVFTGRTTPASYVDESGVFKEVPAGTERTQAYGVNEAGNLVKIGVLRENAATNLISNSDEFTVGWSNSGPAGSSAMTVTPSQVNGPRGANTMTLLSKDNTSVRYLSKTFTSPIGSQVTASVYAKPAESGGILTMRMQTNYSNRVDAWFNLTTGVCGVSRVGDLTTINAYMSREPNGTYRCAFTATGGAVVWNSLIITNQDRDGASVDSTALSVPQPIYVDSAQVESNPFATSYIRTTTTAVNRAADTYTSSTVTRAADTHTASQTTRAADLVTSGSATRIGDNIYMPSISDWFNQPASTFYTEFTPGTIGVGNTCVSFWLRNVADNNNIVAIRKDGSQNNITGIVTSATGVIQAQITANSPVAPGTVAKTVMSYKLDSASISTNGSAIVNDPLITPPLPERMYLGSSSNNQQFCNGWIGKILYYPIWMSNPQLPLVTAK